MDTESAAVISSPNSKPDLPVNFIRKITNRLSMRKSKRGAKGSKKQLEISMTEPECDDFNTLDKGQGWFF